VGEVSRKIKVMALSILYWLALVIVTFVFLFPLINTIMLAFKSDIDIVSLPPKLIFKPVLDHFIKAFATGGYHFDKYFMNSIFIASLSTLINLGVSITSAYAVSRYRMEKIMLQIISLRFFPPILFTIPFYIMFSVLGLRDTIPGIAIAHVLLNLPITFPILVGMIDEIPREVEEAAMIDGCGTLEVLKHITIPLLTPAVIAVSFINFVFSWNEYLIALILSSVNATPITVGAGLFIRSFGVQYGELAAVTTAAILLPIIIVISFKDYIIKGLTMGVR
jgi:multiple sugar transport system permease protein